MPVQNIKKFFQDWVMPEIQAIRGELKALDAKIDSLRNEVLSIRNELLSEIRRVETRIDTAIDVHERLAALEAKIKH